MDSAPGKFNPENHRTMREPITPGTNENKPVEKASFFGILGLTARPRELTRNQKIQGAQDAVNTAKLREKITQTAESNKDKKDPYEGVFEGHREIKTKKLLYSLARTDGKKLANELGIAHHLVDSKSKRIELGKQLLGENASSYISARSVRQKLAKLNRDPQAVHRDQIAEKIFNKGRKSNWEAVRKEKEVLKKILGDKK